MIRHFIKSPTSGLYYRHADGSVACDVTKEKADLFTDAEIAFAPPECIKEAHTKLEFMRWIAREGGRRSTHKKTVANRAKRQRQILRKNAMRRKSAKRSARHANIQPVS
jgi:hypothetical protein